MLIIFYYIIKRHIPKDTVIEVTTVTFSNIMHFHFSLLYGSTALLGLGCFFSFLIYTQSVGLLGRRISPSQGAAYTQNDTNTEETNTDIHALSEIVTNDPSVRADEDLFMP
jgi:hypothetical protein